MLVFYISAAAILLILFGIRLILRYREKIRFFATGHDSQFRLKEIRALWKLALDCNIEDPMTLYVSVPTLNRCISQFLTLAKSKGQENTYQTQSFLTKLYDYRTRIAIDKENKKGMDDTRSLMKGQRIRIILRGKGVFESEILSSGHELIFKIPKQDGMIKVPGDEWEGHEINVYLWKRGDASYVFDSVVTGSGMFNGDSCIHVAHTNKLLRAQKRQSVRCDCKIDAQLYIIKQEIVDYKIVENTPGYKCLLENISEDGAMIRIGGKGMADVQLKLQFSIGETFIMMFGVVRSVEYNETINQSRLHFECTHIEPSMKNAILTYVYNVIPEEQKEINRAIEETQSDAIDSGEDANVVEEAITFGGRRKTDEQKTESDVLLPEESINIPDLKDSEIDNKTLEEISRSLPDL